MTGRSLDPDERALWQRVTASVRALHRQAEAASEPPPNVPPERPPPVARPPAALKRAARPQTVGATLDGGWDRRLQRGTVAPDAVLDLHGHNLASAHAALDAALARSLMMGDRLLLVITGRPPRPAKEHGGEEKRGVIRAALPDWLTHSPHARRIAAVRAAHPRHGGAGALYLILRRER